VNLAWIITAAGQSRRHPPNKLLLPLDGVPAILRTVAHILPLPGEKYLVTGHDSQRMSTLVSDRFGSKLNLIPNPHYEEGLGTSVRAGVQAAGQDVDYWCFVPGDKPFLKTGLVECLLPGLEADRSSILVPRVQGVPGHPTFFASTFWGEFMCLDGEDGGSRIGKAHPDAICYVECEEEGYVLDLDRYLERGGR